MPRFLAAVCFSDVMPEKKDKLVQLGVRVPEPLRQRAVNFTVANPWQPSLAFIVERALTEFLDREEPKLPKPPKR